MDFEFDPAKDALNRLTHGLSLEDAAAFDLEAAQVVVGDRKDYGEIRYRAFGRIDGIGHCLVFTVRGSSLRLISFRRVHEKELRRYDR